MRLFTSNSKMSRSRAIWCATLALLLVIPLVLVIWGFLLPCQYEDTFLGELKYKVQRLEDTASPRLILVGGSGAAFAVDSRYLEQELPGFTVVNFGMYAALGTTVMLDLSEDLLRPGDIVILMPEQTGQTLSDYFDPAVMWQGLDGAFSLIRHLPGEKRRALLGAFPTFAGQKLRYAASGQRPEPQGVYARASFNVYGDVESSLCDGNVMPEGFDPDTPVRFDAEVLDESFVRRVNEYAAAAEDRGAEVWYAFCPMNALAVTGDACPEEFYQTLRERLQIPIIGDPRDSLLDGGWFYDTNFHLNNSGKLIYTRVLLEGIKAMLGDSSPTEIPVPEMPDPSNMPVWQGEDGDVACFTYEAADGGWRITGLSAEGREKNRLTVPSRYQDQPVLTLDAGAFSGGRAEEIHIQQNIRSILDGAFSGCEELRTIRMLQETPSACRVGQGLLTGTEAVILVPKEALSAYRTDYFWSIYSPELKAAGDS